MLKEWSYVEYARGGVLPPNPYIYREFAFSYPALYYACSIGKYTLLKKKRAYCFSIVQDHTTPAATEYGRIDG